MGEGKVTVTGHDGTVTGRHCHHQQERNDRHLQPSSARHTVILWKPVRWGRGGMAAGGGGSALFLAPLLGINPPRPCPHLVLGGKEGPSKKQACRATMFLELLPDRKRDPGSGLFTEKKLSSRVGRLSGLRLTVPHRHL